MHSFLAVFFKIPWVKDKEMTLYLSEVFAPNSDKDP
jgi:hypothetical protein